MKLAHEAGRCTNCKRTLYVRKGIHFHVATAPCPMCMRNVAGNRQRAARAPVLAIAYSGPGLMGPPVPLAIRRAQRTGT